MITETIFIDKLNAEVAWRKRELSNLKFLVSDTKISKNNDLQNVLIRASVAMLYAHWEGYVKHAGSSYLEYVINLRKPTSDLTSNFVAIRVKTQINEICSSKKYSTAINLVDLFRKNLNNLFKINHKNIINTESNLSSKVFIEILAVLGLEEKDYMIKISTIDARLLNSRNKIAHGENLILDLPSYLALHDEILTLMIQFHDQIQNAVAQKIYLANSN